METAAASGSASQCCSVKRKTLEPARSPGSADAKRIRLGDDGFDSQASPGKTFHLPAEIWQRIFSLLPPKTLGCLMAVNRHFHECLDPCSPVEDNVSQPRHDSRFTLPPLKPDAIWQASRRLFWPHMPGPLKGRSEIDMWRLCCTRFCQFCGTRERPGSENTQDRWHRGPGAKGVSPVFPLFLVTCGRCLSENTLKEVHIFLSPSMPSFLLAGLAMAFVTPELHVIPPQLLFAGSDPTHSQVAKVFSSEQVKAIYAEFEGVQALGHATAEEWVKALENRGKRSLADASRWERWYLTGGVHDMRTSLQSLHSSTQTIGAASSTRVLDAQAPVNESQKPGGDVMQTRDPPTPIIDLTRTSPKTEIVITGTSPRPVGQAKPAEKEAVQLKALRPEIERRAGLLQPPFTPDDLSRVPAFLAMVRMPAPLDERAWETLKKRLLEHREAAERLKKGPAPDAAHPNGMVATETKAPGSSSSRHAADKEWYEAQGPLRARISGFADEIIRHNWNGGTQLSKKNASQFAVEVLLHVRKRFYAEVAKDAAAAPAAGKMEGKDPSPGPPWTQKLTLENMRWIFDTKIKEHTDRHSTELFSCTGCPSQRKAFCLQGVIQHYAAKHTAALSIGTLGANWRAEWPETPIFKSDTSREKPKQAGDGYKSAVLQPPPPHGCDSSHQALAPASHPPTGASNQAHARAARAPDALQVPPVPVPIKPPPARASLRQAPQHPPAPAHSSHPQQAQLVGLCPPEQGPGASTTGKLNASHTNNSAAPADPLNRGPYVARLNYMARTCKDVWRKIAHMQYLPDAAKAQVLLHHIVARFEEKFSERASLSTFIDGLSNHRDMRPARSIKRLYCKMCDPSSGAEAQTKSLTFPQLLKHFNMNHNEGAGDQPDWHANMIRYTDRRATIPELQKGLGKHEAALQIVTDALPWATQVKAPQAPAVHRRPGQISGGTQQKANQVKAENPEHADSATATRQSANLSQDVVTHDHGDRPHLQPARMVYRTADRPCDYRPDRHVSQGGKTHQAKPEFRCVDGEQHPWAASAPRSRLHKDCFGILGSHESHLEPERGVATPRDPQRQDARYGAQLHTSSERTDHAGNREYLAAFYEYGVPYPPYALPGYDRSVQGYYQEPGPWGPQAPSAIRQDNGYRAYRAYPQGLPVQSVQVAEQSPSRMDYDEYDPRYPETGRGAAAASRETRR
ncbi:F-box domain containing protein [Ophiocordyceps sinensis CO18]|uniref:F-box domain containing protein n=1 Tax=Ophiocordyceps sinensis (strain Co18 / CGMCC 3.14243) TaxID=911162 RepID=T5A0T3_OPHSC|nr:F-box domain containing protein [Ophiocordyceps sinensis CO18]